MSAPAVVLAAGTLTPSLLGSAAAANGFQPGTAFKVTQTTVLGIPGLILPAVVCIGGGPHLIPHRTTAPVLADRAAKLLGGVLSGAPGAPGQGTVDVADQPFRADRAALAS